MIKEQLNKNSEPQNRDAAPAPKATQLIYAIDGLATQPYPLKSAFLETLQKDFEINAMADGFCNSQIGFVHIGQGDCILEIYAPYQDMPENKSAGDLSKIFLNTLSNTYAEFQGDRTHPLPVYMIGKEISYDQDLQSSLKERQALPYAEPETSDEAKQSYRYIRDCTQTAFTIPPTLNPDDIPEFRH